MRKLSIDERYARLHALTKGVAIVPLTKAHITKAIAHPTKDFEDMLQYQSAVAGQCDCIVTINANDFAEFSSLPIYSPDELLDILDE